MRGHAAVVIALITVGAPTTVVAQPAEGTAPLAAVRDERQLAEMLSVITQDPAVQVDDPEIRGRAQALMTEGVRQLQARAFDQALANFLEAYNQFPSPRILLNIAATLRDMGRLADAANTYQRYLLDPATGAERVAVAKELLLRLDEELTILTVRVFPRGSDVSIDGGPFIPVGSSLLTRVRPGLHLVRIRRGDVSSELTVNGFEGEHKEVAATLKVPTPPDPAPMPTTGPPPSTNPAIDRRPPATADQVDGWLITGTHYTADSGTGRERRVRTGYAGPELTAIMPRRDSLDDVAIVEADDDDRISSGLLGVVRIDGEGRGFAGGFGLALSWQRLEGEVMVLRSDSTGGYVGARVRLLTGWFRPYVAAGIPGFVFDELDATGMATSTRLAIGVRGAAGLELRLNGHLSVQGDVGLEHFFNVGGTGIDPNIVVPTLGIIGRL